MTNEALIERYKEYLPVSDETPIISIGEGGTPLLKLNRYFNDVDETLNVYAKFEGLNPTGSFKDRGMTLAISKAVEDGAKAVICASTGNTSAAAAAYAARANLSCVVIVPKGHVAIGKLSQAIVHGAKVLQIDGNFDDGLDIVKQLEREYPLVLVNSMNPFRRQGQKTAAFEIIDSLGHAPDYHAIPVGNAANISAYWQGYKEFFDKGKSNKKPKMLGYQAEGASPLVSGKFIEKPETLASAIRIGKPQSYELAVESQKESQGWFSALTDEEILSAQLRLASLEGIFAEPASAASVAGVYKDVIAGKIAKGSTITCTLTGHGLKDPNIITETLIDAINKVSDNYIDIANVVGKYLERG